eukprot:352743-Chlamydomonas_euryale.AAC.3
MGPRVVDVHTLPGWPTRPGRFNESPSKRATRLRPLSGCFLIAQPWDSHCGLVHTTHPAAFDPSTCACITHARASRHAHAAHHARASRHAHAAHHACACLRLQGICATRSACGCAHDAPMRGLPYDACVPTRAASRL